MDDDLGLIPETDRKAKQGRRAAQQQAQQQPQKTTPPQSRQAGDFGGSLLEKSQERRNRRADGGEQLQKSKISSSLIDDEPEDAEEKPTRASGKPPKSTWDIDPTSGRADDAYEDERLLANAGKKGGSDAESDADIPMIPELEDTKDAVVGDTEGGVISVSPGVVTKVATYRELEDDLMKHLPFLTLDQEVDLKPLTKFLIPEAFTAEPDVPWEWETLYAEVASELMKEIESLQNLNLNQEQTTGNSAL